MPKLLSRSKHEEFKLNSTLQIKYQKERRAKCEENWTLQESFSSVHCTHLQRTVPSCSPCSPVFHAFVLFVIVFGFSPFYPCCNHLCLDCMVLHLVCKPT